MFNFQKQNTDGGDKYYLRNQHNLEIRKQTSISEQSESVNHHTRPSVDKFEDILRVET